MITTVTLNASVDKAYHMASPIAGGTVMRVQKCRNSAGGKGLNVSRVVKICGADVKATGLVGGYNGQYLETLLDEDGIPHQFGKIAGETRSCINILDPAFTSTEFLEPGRPVSETEIDTYLDQFPDIIKDAEIVTLSGSAPAGSPKDIYAKLIHIAKNAGKKVLLDTSGDLLKAGISAAPDFIKPNQDEIEALFDTKIHDISDVIACAKKLHADGIAYVVISLGGDGSLFVCDAGVYQAIPPKIDVVNTVGCGDSMVAGFAVALERNLAPEDALKYASAVASANALSPNTGDFDPDVMKQLYEKTTVKSL